MYAWMKNPFVRYTAMTVVGYLGGTVFPAPFVAKLLEMVAVLFA